MLSRAHLVVLVLMLLACTRVLCSKKHHGRGEHGETLHDIKHIIKKLDKLDERLQKLEQHMDTCNDVGEKMMADQAMSQEVCADISKTLEDYLQKLSGELDEKLRGAHNSQSHVSASFSSGQNYVQQPKNCAEIYEAGRTDSGVYTIFIPPKMAPVKVSCDMDAIEGGWTVIQRRFDGSINFTRDWDDYSKGFGEVDGEFWLGNSYLHHMTKTTPYKLKVDLEDFDGKTAVAEYSKFKVESESHDYRLTLKDYWGTGGDSFNFIRGYLKSDGMRFSTYDRDNDESSENLAEKYRGGWWYNQHTFSTVNGMFSGSPDYSREMQAMIWFTWRGYHGIKSVQIKIKPELCPCA